ncbi:MAG: hypothetical protein ABIG60_05910 [Patescibacteria group bacterium]
MPRILFFISMIGLSYWFVLIAIQSQNLPDNSSARIKILKVKKDNETGRIVQVDSPPIDNYKELSKAINEVGGAPSGVEQEIQDAWSLFVQAKANTDEEAVADSAEHRSLILKDQENEILANTIIEDTNDDGEKEILIVTEKINSENNKAQTIFYIINREREILFEYHYVAFSPDSIETKIYANDNYPSYFLIFDSRPYENNVIRWNGEEYIIQKLN